MTLKITPLTGDAEFTVKNCRIEYEPGDTGIHLHDFPDFADPLQRMAKIESCHIDTAELPQGAYILVSDGIAYAGGSAPPDVPRETSP